MGHHFDSPEARADSRINITDNYLFPVPADPTRVVAVMCVSPLAGLPSPYHGEPQWRTFRPGCAYELRFDIDGDLVTDVAYRFVFGDEGAPQQWTLTRVTGDGEEVIGAGQTGITVELDGSIRVYVGEAGDPFWLDAVAAKTFLDAVLAGQPFTPDAFSSGSTTTAATNVLAVVVELPLAALGADSFNFHTAVAARDHGNWTQVSRCGRPNFAATFVDDPERSRRMNETTPVTDVAEFSEDVIDVVSRAVRNAGTHPDPDAYAQRAVRSLLPDVIPYDASLPAGMDFAGVNGRTLTDDFGALVYSVVFNHPMRTALPPLGDLRDTWPWVSPPRPLPAGPAIAVPDRNEP